MGTPRPIAVTDTGSRLRGWLGVILIVAGLCGHLFAASAIGGSRRAYRDHIFGFCLILLVTGAVIAALGWWLWRGRRDVTLLLVGLVQALFGLFVYVERYSVH